jgi:hypothetical protein
MINEKSYQIIAVDILGNVEVVCNCLTYDIAEDMMSHLKESMKNFGSRTYSIEEINNEG